MLNSMLDGYNVCIFSYGQIGHERLAQWRDLSRIKDSITGLWSSYLKLMRRGNRCLHTTYLLVFLKSTISKL